MKNIIDISNYQGDIDFAKIAKQIDGAIIRCGITFWGNFVPSEDVRWEKNYAGFKAAASLWEPITWAWQETLSRPGRKLPSAWSCWRVSSSNILSIMSGV